MVRAEPRTNCTAGTETNHSTMFRLLLELNVICEQKWIQFELQNSPSRVFVFDGKLHYHLANLRNRITTKIFDIFRIITLKQQKFSQSNPVLIRQFSKKLQSDPVLIRPKLASVLIPVQTNPVLICAHLCLRQVFRRLSVLKLRSAVAVEAGSVASGGYSGCSRCSRNTLKRRKNLKKFVLGVAFVGD